MTHKILTLSEKQPEILELLQSRKKNFDPFSVKNELRQHFQVYHLNSKEPGVFMQLI